MLTWSQSPVAVPAMPLLVEVAGISISQVVLRGIEIVLIEELIEPGA